MKSQNENIRKKLMEWEKHHKYLIIYMALVTTLTLLLAILEYGKF
jgi:hypothetical protein